MIYIDEPELLEAIYEFIEKFGSIPNDAILQAYQREIPFKLSDLTIHLENGLEENSEENLKEKLDHSFALISLKDIEAKGSQIHSTICSSEDNKADIECSSSLNKAAIEIEIFSLLQFEVQRSIQLLSAMFTHPRGIEFFNSKGLSPLYAEKIQASTSLEKESKYYSMRLICHLSYYSHVKEEVDTFSRISLSLQNVDSNYL